MTAPPIELTVKHVADGAVIAGLIKCTFTPIAAIFGGALWGHEAFIAGAVVVATIAFGEFYFRDPDDAL